MENLASIDLSRSPVGILLKLRGEPGARAVARQAAASRLTRPDLTSLCVTDEQVLLLLDDVRRPRTLPFDPAGSSIAARVAGEDGSAGWRTTAAVQASNEGASPCLFGRRPSCSAPPSGGSRLRTDHRLSWTT
jgi:hypothetical protein